LKKTDSFLLAVILLFLTGCEDKKTKEPILPIENTTNIVTKQEKKERLQTQKESIVYNTSSIKQVSSEVNKHQTVTPLPTTLSPVSSDTFILNDTHQNRYTVTFKGKKLMIQHLKQSIVLINFFATWCPPCRGEIPYLSDLQKKYKEDLFVAGVLVNDEPDSHTLKEFIKKYQANYFISNSIQNNMFVLKLAKALHLPNDFPIPLTVIYKDGNYYRHYEGAVPIEMIEYDIKQALKK